jgi:hypothetical protein
MEIGQMTRKPDSAKSTPSPGRAHDLIFQAQIVYTSWQTARPLPMLRLFRRNISYTD